MTKQNISIAALSLMLLVSGGLTSVEAMEKVEGEERQERERSVHIEKMNELFSNQDVWAEHMAKRGVDSAVLNDELFIKMQAAHEAAKEGDFSAMKSIKEELGIEKHRRRGHKGHKAGKILELDFESWKEKATERGLEAEKVTEETFTQLQKAATLRQAGEREEAKALIESLGIERPNHDERKTKKRAMRSRGTAAVEYSAA